MHSTVEQIRTALASAYPITLLVSPEEERQKQLLDRFAAAAKPEELPVFVWNCVDGFVDHGSENHSDPMEALAWIGGAAPKGLYLLKDIGDMLDSGYRRQDPKQRTFHIPAATERRPPGLDQTSDLCGGLALPG